MEQGIGIWRCTNCKAGYFPERLICPACRAAEFVKDRVYEGVLEEITVVRHVLGQQDIKPIRVGSVRTSDGQLLLVGLRGDFAIGSTIELFEESKAPFAGIPGAAAA
jgi:uncharacterized OB-fold protein